MDTYINANLARQRLPELKQVAGNLWCAHFGLMKQVVAFRAMEDAEQRGELRPHMRVIESTSGTMGLGIALEAAARGYAVSLASDPAVDPGLKSLLETLDAEVEIVTATAPGGGHQIPRLQRLRELRERHGRSNCWWLRQYHNPSNARAYAPVARYIAHHLGRIDIVVFPVGSGGSMTGTTEVLRALNHPAAVVAVDTPRSILFTPYDGERQLRGLGNSVMPENLRHDLVDQVHWVCAPEAFKATRELYRRFTIAAGPTTGAAYIAARYVARLNPAKSVVFFGPDSAQRYLTTVYNRAYCQARGLFCDSLPDVPREVRNITEVAGPWSQFPWRRRSYRDVTGVDPSTLYAPDLDDIEISNTGTMAMAPEPR